MAAKVDSATVQDGYQLYRHAFFFSGEGDWYGIPSRVRSAEAICSDQTAPTLNLVAAEHDLVRRASVALATESPDGRAMARAKVDRCEKVDALKRRSRFARNTEPV